jgi:dihydrofolate reductase
MRKIILYIATSLNGKIADANGNVTWLDKTPNPDNCDYGFSDFFARIDTTIQGNRTYEQVIGWGIDFPYKDKKNYVLTNDPVDKESEYVDFISENHFETLAALKASEGKDIWLIGGGQANTFLLNNRLIDEIRQFIMPIILPAGIDLFYGKPMETMLELIEVKKFSSGVVEVCYKVINS